MKNRIGSLVITVLLCFSQAALAQDEGLSERIQSIKEGVLNLNRDLSLLEDELLYASSQASFYLSVDVGTPIRLVDINLTLDGRHVGYHFYSEEEFQALSKGGIQRLYNGNLESGRHTLKATITGYDPNGKDYRKTTSYEFTKGPDKKRIELRVLDDLNSQQHRFEFREWDE